MKKIALLFLAVLIIVTGCAKFEPLEPLSNEQVDALLAKAKKQAGVENSAFEQKTLTDAEIAGILETVKNAPVEPLDEREVAILETNFGTMVFTFYNDVAPNHSQNFKRLVKTGYYDGTLFHRIIKEFMAQGGDILSRDADPANDGTGGPGYNVNAEFNDKPHGRGVLSMARSNDPNSAGSQFFICFSRGRTAHLDGKYTAFGQMIGGIDVLDKIEQVETAGPQGSTPVTPVILQKAYWLKR